MERVRVLVVGDKGDDDIGFVGQRLVKHGAALEPLDRDGLPEPDAADTADLLYLLGSARSAHDPVEADPVVREVALVRGALSRGVPVLGVCYGAQLLALTLGGQVEPAAHGEFGWCRVTSHDARLCPPGPWLQFHLDAFTVPAGVRVLGSSSAGNQGIAYEGPHARAVAWQFHPETTPEVLSRWLDSAADIVREQGGDPVAIRAEARARAATARAAAYQLTDAALGWLGAGSG